MKKTHTNQEMLLIDILYCINVLYEYNVRVINCNCIVLILNKHLILDLIDYLQVYRTNLVIILYV